MTEESKPPTSLSTVIQALTNDEQDPGVVQTVVERVQQILTSDEHIQYVAVQKRPLINIAPDCVVLTNRRFIVYRPKLLGQASFEDYSWRDLQDAKLDELILGSTFTMKTIDGRLTSADYLPRTQARRLYAFAQEMEERVRELGGTLTLESGATAGTSVKARLPIGGNA